MLQNQKVALPCVKMIDYDDTLGIDLDQTAADVARFVIPFPCVVEEAGVIITETCAGTVKGVVKFDLRVTAGSDTGRGDGDIATLNMGVTAVGKYLYDLVAVDTELEPGDEIFVQISVAPTVAPAGHFEPVLVVKARDETKANSSNAVVTT
jgi:hypothetical protein